MLINIMPGNWQRRSEESLTEFRETLLRHFFHFSRRRKQSARRKMSENGKQAAEDHLFEFCIRFSFVFCLLPLHDVKKIKKRKKD